VLRRDSKLSKVIKQVGDYEIKISRNRFESLVEAIITQQLSGAAAKSISTKFCSLYSARFPRPADVLATSDSKLKKAGLSSMKRAYIKDLAKKIEHKQVRLNIISKMSDEEVIAELTKIKGIGRWTAEMFLIFSLGRLDVLPVGDLGLQKGVQLLYGLSYLPSGIEIRKIAEKWRPYRTVATWYLWKSLKKFDTIG